MTDRPDFEDRLAARLQAHADRAARPFDAAAVTAGVVAAGGRRGAGGRAWWHGAPGTRRSTLRVAFVGLLLVVAGAAGTILVGAALRGPTPVTDPRLSVVQPTATATVPPVADTNPTPIPTPTPVISVSSPDPSLAAAGVGVGPCAAMVQLLASWAIYEPDPPVHLGPAGRPSNGYILAASADDYMSAIDGSSDTLKLPTEPPDPIPGIPGYGGPIARGGRFVPAPDGRAIAVEMGDLGAAGCSEPLVRYAKGGMLRPFEARAFQAITDLAWAPDGSALYAILRPTIDPAGQPATIPDGGTATDRSGVVLRWDAGNRKVTDLGNPCSTCWLAGLTVSPDAANLVADTAGDGTWVHGSGGSWRQIRAAQHDFGGTEIIGWTPDVFMVVDGYDHIDTVDLTGRVVTTSGLICCHGNGYGGLLSPDGTTVVGSTLGSDFRWRNIVQVDVRDGTQKTIAKMSNPTAQGLKCPPAPCASTPGRAPTVPFGRIVDWAPDGKSLLMLDQAQDVSVAKVWTLPLDTLEATEPVEVPWNQPLTVAWLPKLP